jgi:hypothetical protein
MNKRILVSTALIGVFAMTVICAAIWRHWSKRYIVEWRLPFRSQIPGPVAKAVGNVCILQHANVTGEPLICADIYLFPHVYGAIGVSEKRMVEWQNKNGFDSGGVDPTGAFLAPGFPVFSRLAWTQIAPVYLQGDELSGLLGECKRISAASDDPSVKSSLDRLAALAQKAQADSRVLRFFG